MSWCVRMVALASILGGPRLIACDEVADSDLELKLSAFCRESILYDRGFSNPIYPGTTEEMLCRYFVKDRELQAAFGLTGQQINLLKSPPRSPSNISRHEPQARSGGTCSRLWRADDPYRRHLQSILTVQQHERLPELYLQIEGLMALSRPEFRKIIGISAEEQKRIEELVKRVWVDTAAVCYRAIFVMRSQEQFRDEFSWYHAELRIAGAKLDQDILGLLAREQRLRLWSRIRNAQTFRPLVRLPGPTGTESK